MIAKHEALVPRLRAFAAAAACALGLMLLTGAALAEDGSVEAGKAKSTTCAACHGQTGNSVAPNWPSLAGQHPAYIVRQLNAYKNGERDNAAMMGFASMLSEQDMRDLAAFFSSQSMTPKGADPKLVTRGQEIYRGGIPERGIPACIGCHGPSGHGNYLAAYPRIAGQNAEYVLDTLKAYAAGTRRSDPNQMMRNVASQLLEDEMRAVASYVQGLQQGDL
ncbi:MAG TPA: c-type cytochrome [Gammaproteobacteria bacterium]|nr:c-type cytochrome [Gammaproteobacteria bacterium]